jgi:hypothetical protein
LCVNQLTEGVGTCTCVRMEIYICSVLCTHHSRSTINHTFEFFHKIRRTKTTYPYLSSIFFGWHTKCTKQKFLHDLIHARHTCIPPPVFFIFFAPFRARIFKLLRSPRIDSKEPIPPGCVAWRAGTTTLFLLGS